jgi:hypothetical protein
VSRYNGTEAQRLASTRTPGAGEIGFTEAGLFVGDGATLGANLAPLAPRPGNVQTRLSPLARIGKALTGPFRVYLMGTSIANFDSGLPKVFAELLRDRYGAARWTFFPAGGAGGSYDADFSGWKKQRYGGNIYHRIRADSTATAFTWEFYGDFCRVEFSQEADSTAVSVLVDGTLTGNSPAAGSQAYRQAVTWSGALGYHVITLNVPTGAGYVYLETIEAGLSTRLGVEVIDSTLGGSAIANAINVWAKSAAQTANPIPIVGNNGLDYHFSRTDIDLYVIEHDMNDGTYSLWKQGIDYAVAQTKSRGVPLVLIGEPHNDYATNVVQQQKRSYLLALGATYGHVTVIDWHPMLACNGDVTAMNTLYYGGSAGPNYPHPVQGPAYSVGVDALCRASGISPPRAGVDYLASAVRRAQTTKSLDTSEQQPKQLTVAGVTSIAASPAGRVGKARTLTSQDTWDYSGYFYRADCTGATMDLTATVAAAATSDTNGPYIDAASQAVYVQAAAGDVGATMRLTVLANAAPNGLLQFGFSTDVIRFEDDMGNTLPINAGPGRNMVIYGAPPIGKPPAAYTVICRANAATGINFNLKNGRFYMAILAVASDPVLPLAAGTAPPPRLVGQTSMVKSGYWSNPSISGALTTYTVNPGGRICVPFNPEYDAKITQIGFDVTAGAGASWDARVYDSDPVSGTPRNNLGAATGTSALGWNTGSIAQQPVLKAGKRYWLTINTGAGITMRSINAVVPEAVTTGVSLSATGAYRIATPNANASPWDITAESNPNADGIPWIRALIG